MSILKERILKPSALIFNVPRHNFWYLSQFISSLSSINIPRPIIRTSELYTIVGQFLMIALCPRYLDKPPWAQISRRTIPTEVTSSPSLIVFSPRFNTHPLVHRNLWSVNCHLCIKICLWQLKISIPKQAVIWGVWLLSPWTLLLQNCARYVLLTRVRCRALF